MPRFAPPAPALPRASLLCALLALSLTACLDDETAAVDAGPDRADAAPDGGGGEGEAPFDCAAICETFEADCPQALAIVGDCNDCTDLADGLAETPDEPILRRASTACQRAEETADCRAFAVCLTDDDGHNAGAPGGVSVTITQDNGDVEIAASDDAWAVVGAKGDGAPGDLEVYFVVGETFYGIEFDDLANAADAAPLDAADYPVSWLTAEETIEYAIGTITLDAWALDGAIDVTAAVSGEAPDTGITIRVTGSLSQ